MHIFRPKKGSRSFFVLRTQEKGCFPNCSYPGTCKFNLGTGLGMAGCSYVEARCKPSVLQVSLIAFSFAIGFTVGPEHVPLKM